MKFHDPRAEMGARDEAYELSFDCAAGAAKVGLLANGFPDSVKFLEILGRELSRQHPALEMEVYDKGNASVVAPPELLERLSRECKAVITAYGH